MELTPTTEKKIFVGYVQIATLKHQHMVERIKSNSLFDAK
jgi:hypothetical protein